MLDPLDVGLAQFAKHTRRDTSNKRTRWYDLALEDNGTCGNNRLLANYGAIEHDRTNANQAMITNRGPVHHSSMSIVVSVRSYTNSFVGVQASEVLNIGRSPIRIHSVSPRMTAPNQTLLPAASWTVPTTWLWVRSKPSRRPIQIDAYC